MMICDNCPEESCAGCIIEIRHDLEDQPPVPGGTTAIRDGQYVTEDRAPGPSLGGPTMTDPLRDWWDSLSELDQFNAYRIEKSNADALALTREPGLDVDGVRAAWLALALGRRSRGGSDEWWEMPATLSEALAIAREYGVIAEEEATKYAALASEDRP